MWAFVILILVLVFRPQACSARGWWIEHDYHAAADHAGAATAIRPGRWLGRDCWRCRPGCLAFLPWAYAFQALDGMSLFGYPSPLQILGMVLGLLVAGLIICSRRIKPRGKIRVGWVRGAKAAGTGALVFLILVTVAIALELGGLVNVVWGGWIALLGAVIAFIGT